MVWFGELVVLCETWLEWTGGWLKVVGCFSSVDDLMPRRKATECFRISQGDARFHFLDFHFQFIVLYSKSSHFEIQINGVNYK